MHQKKQAEMCLNINTSVKEIFLREQISKGALDIIQ